MAKAKLGLIRPNVPVMQTEPLGVTANTVFKAKSGRIVYLASGYLSVATAAQSGTFGIVDCGDLTAESTDGDTKLSVIVDKNQIFEMPVDTAFDAAALRAIIGDTCDIIVTSNIQYADYDATLDDVIRIVGGSVVDQILYVQLCDATAEETGVA